MDKRVGIKNAQCSGCGLCSQICPKSAIMMRDYGEGFLYPYVDSDRCIECGLCIKDCINNVHTAKSVEQCAYAVKHMNIERRMESTSGGMFSAIAELVCRNHGVVYGVTINANMTLEFKKCQTIEECQQCIGTKYVQCNLHDTYDLIDRDIRSNRIVLFVGTPCQVMAIKSYCKIKRINDENVIYADLICHGVGSPRVWEDHIKNIEKRYKQRVINYKFRTKIHGWRGHCEAAVLEDGTRKYDCKEIDYLRELYGMNLHVRLSCFSCQYASLARCGDMTIGDFWGIEKINQNIDDNCGISLVLVNTEKGRQIFEKLDNVEAYECNVQSISQPQLEHPAVFPVNRVEFWKFYDTHGYAKTVRKYCKFGRVPPVVRLKRFVKRSLNLENEGK